MPARVIFESLPPGRPAFGGEIRAVIVGEGAAQDLRAVVGRRSGDPAAPCALPQTRPAGVPRSAQWRIRRG